MPDGPSDLGEEAELQPAGDSSVLGGLLPWPPLTPLVPGWDDLSPLAWTGASDEFLQPSQPPQPRPPQMLQYPPKPIALRAPQGARGEQKPRGGRRATAAARGRPPLGYWEARLAELRAYLAASPTGELPEKTCGELGAWVDSMKRRRKYLSRSKASVLAAIPGWEWAKKRRRTSRIDWDERADLLAEYVERRGGLPDGGHPRFGKRVVAQQKSRTTMARERQAILENIPGWSWSMRSASSQSFC